MVINQYCLGFNCKCRNIGVQKVCQFCLKPVIINQYCLSFNLALACMLSITYYVYVYGLQHSTEYFALESNKNEKDWNFKCLWDTFYIYRGIVDSPKEQLVYVCHNEDPLAVTLPLVIGLLFRKGVADVLVAICICLNAIGYHSYISFLANKDVILRSWLIRFIYSILQFQY